jgi:carboxymethylenebutenolidase
MGAHWAVWLSQQPGNPIRKVVLYYGARGGNFAASRASYLAHFAEADPWVSATARRGMEKALGDAGRRYRAFDYPGTGHWFAESDSPETFDAAAARCAFTRTLAQITGDHSGISAQ